MEKITVFEAFAGYGSQSLALERLKNDMGLEYEVIGISEIDPTAIKAYYAARDKELLSCCDSIIELGNVIRGGYQPPKQLVEKYPNFGDISKINWEEVPDFNLFTYSFPCTDISNAGLQKGLAEGSGTRSSLLWECARAIEIKRPKYLLMENVKALVSDKFMPDFKKWAKYLENLGYSNHYQVLNAKDFGVPQNRERVFMVSILGDAIYYFPKPFKLERRLKHVLESNVDESYYLSDEKIQAIISHCERKQAEGCGFRTNFQDVRTIDLSSTLRLEFTDRYDQWDMTFRSDGYKLRLSRPCTLHEFVKTFIESAPVWDKEYGAKICTADNKDIFFNKELDKDYADIAIFDKECNAINGYGWQIYGLNPTPISGGGYCGTIMSNYGQRETDTYIRE